MSFYSELKRRNVLRVGAAYVAISWLLIQVVETIFPAFGFGAGAIRIVIILLGVGFVPTVILAWVFELSPEGLKRDSDVDSSSESRIQATKSFDRMIMIVMALALGYFAFDKFLLDPARDAKREATVAEQARNEAVLRSFGDQSIAVMPFVNMSEDASNEYFADGVTEELLNMLARIRDLRVISRTSVFSFKGKDVDIPTVARELNVAHVLEGSVRKAGERVRITTQLIDARTDTNLWSETYDRELDDIFAIQEEIAASVVAKMEGLILERAPSPVETDLEAYTLYLQARSLVVQGKLSKEQRSHAESLLKRVLEVDPNYVPALNELIRVYWQRTWQGTSLSLDEGKRLMDELSEKVFAIDPENAVAHAGRAWRAIEFGNDFVTGAQHLQRALAADPTNEDVLWAAVPITWALGRNEEAIALSEYGVARNPMFSGIHNNLITAYYLAGRFDEVEVAAREFSLLFWGNDYRLGHALLMKGNIDAALAAFRRIENEWVRKAGTAKAFHSLGRQSEFESAVSWLEEHMGERKADDIAMVHAWAGNADAAFAWLYRWFEGQIVPSGDTWIPDIGSISFVLHDPMFRNLHSDPRWQPLLVEKGVARHQLAEIEFEINLPK